MPMQADATAPRLDRQALPKAVKEAYLNSIAKHSGRELCGSLVPAWRAALAVVAKSCYRGLTVLFLLVSGR
ncbi:hypothetical protein DPM33_00440 [Mesorhizobium hawassense]|uniref:Uncharacterized protein n=1 Tax=Mesorhizobium hawassense TaxID=1209954 RepID=A0A330HUR9_9HYPH|nr:hypothetical protein DPM33_00440 [Mesorhizobium hawassense]